VKEGELMNWQFIARKMLNGIGYRIFKTIYKFGDGEYTIRPPYGYATYSPWFEDWFREIYAKIRHHTTVTEDRSYIIYRLSQHCAHTDGDFAECGVYKGGTAFLIAYAQKNNGVREKRLHLFDTFAGMPADAGRDPSRHKESDFGDTSLDAIKEYLGDFPYMAFHPGIIPETFEAVKDSNFAFVHIDVDLYQTAKDCCDFFYERMVRGGIMIFDDYGFPRYRLAEKRAVDEFFSDKPESPISLCTGQCIVIKV
jgi:O-methyltransferase